ncbi:MAG: hypothetical protein AABY15_05180 [Nanoarchaeota archaeon]
MEKKGYVIQKLGYEYNDETYYRPQDGGGTPEIVLTDEVMAKKRMMELEIKEWRGQSIGNYGYGLDEIAEDELEFEKALKAIGLDPEDGWDLDIPKTATDEQIKRLIKASRVRFYEIVEVDIDSSTSKEEDNIGPSEEMLSIQDEMEKRSKKGIFDSVEQFVSGKIKPVVPENVTIDDIKEVIKETDDNFLTIKEEMKRLRDEARVKVKDFFLKGMNKIFEMYPEVKSVSWRQYTPYFNDGEECTFSANVDDFYVNGRDNYGDTMYGYDEEDCDGEAVLNREEMDYDWVNSKKVYKNPGSKSIKIHDAISGFLSQLDDDDYKTMFGDHAIVIVRKNEVVVEEYDHD